MTTWTFNKFLRMYEYETKSEIKELFSDGIYETYLSDVETSDDEKVIEQLREFHEKMKESIELYGTVEEMFEYFKRIDRIEHSEFSDPSSFPKYTDVSGKIVCVLNSDAINYMKFSLMTKLGEFFKYSDIIFKNEKYYFEYFWCLTGLHNVPEIHTLITNQSWKRLYEKLCELCNFENLDSTVKEEESEEIKEFDFKLFDRFKECEDTQLYIDNLVRYLKMLSFLNINKAYSVVAYFHNAVKPLRDELRFLVEPIKKASPNFKPIIRRFKGANYEFYLAKEVSDAFPEENIDTENEENMEYRRVFTVDFSTFDRILSKYGADSVIIVEIPIETNSRNNTYPIYCSYGFHCSPVWELIEDHLYTIIIYQKHFMTSEDVSTVYDSIELKEFCGIVENPVMYLVDHVSCVPEFLIPNSYANDSKIPYKRVYTKTEVTETIKKLVETHYIEHTDIIEIVDKVFEIIPYEFLNYKQIHDLYFRIILRNILKLCPKIARLKENQGKYKKNHESNLVYKAVEEFYESKSRKRFYCEKNKVDVLQNEIIELKRRETNHLKEIGRLEKNQEKYERPESIYLEEIRKLKENQEKYEKQQQDLLRVVCDLKNRLDKSQNDLIDSISSNLNNLSSTYPNSKEIQKAKRDLEKFEENVNIFE